MQLALVKGLLQVFEEEAPEPAREHADGQEEARTAGDPMLAIRADAAAGHDTMQVRVEEQVLSPRVQNGEEADFCAQVLRIGGDGA